MLFFSPFFLEMEEEEEMGAVTYMMSTCSQSAPWSMVREHSWPSWAKSEASIDGAMMGLGAIFGVVTGGGGRMGRRRKREERREAVRKMR